MSRSSRSLDQTLITKLPGRISVTSCYLASSSEAVARLLTLADTEIPLGIAVQLSEKHATVESIAFARGQSVLVISVHAGTPVERGASESLASILDNATTPLAGFSMARMALNIYRDWGYHVRAVDLGVLTSPSTLEPTSPAAAVTDKFHSGDRDLIHAIWSRSGEDDLCMRAWLSASLAEQHAYEIELASKLHTRRLKTDELDCLGRLIHNVELIEADKPIQMENEFKKAKLKGERLLLQNLRYKTRVRPSGQTAIVMDTKSGKTIVGRAVSAVGKTTGIQVLRGKLRTDIIRVRVVGVEELTVAERARDEYLLFLLYGQKSLRSSFTESVWFPVRTTPSRTRAIRSSPQSQLFKMLNLSQKAVFQAMLDPAMGLIIAKGPPGTGKTTAIAAAAEHWTAISEPIYCIAQSNVGVKNMARSFHKKDIDFKLIVSKEFMFEWHDHLYGDIRDSVIRSDRMLQAKDLAVVERLIGGSTVILCTLSMLSNPALARYVFPLVPVKRLIVDEASQIDTFEFMHLFDKFTHLEKVCLFGDPKQLPPFGKDAAPNLQTIFDFKHLKSQAYFLDIQYRMPTPLGNFISNEVYDSKLHSQHPISDTSCIKFLDVRKGWETKHGSSWVNMEEVHTIVNLMRNYYHDKGVAIITPYDSQRSAIARALKKANLPWERVYTVDSFQGHEAPYVIVSVVRAVTPGFLRSQNRMNVMLTRCQRGMVIVTSHRFLTGPGKSILLGKLARYWQDLQEDVSIWTDSRLVSDCRADMPGAPGRPSQASSRQVSTTTTSALVSTPAQLASISTAMSRLSVLEEPASSRGANYFRRVR